VSSTSIRLLGARPLFGLRRIARALLQAVRCRPGADHPSAASRPGLGTCLGAASGYRRSCASSLRTLLAPERTGKRLRRQVPSSGLLAREGYRLPAHITDSLKHARAIRRKAEKRLAPNSRCSC